MIKINLFELFVKIGVDDQASDKVSKISSLLKSGLAKAAKVAAVKVAAAATAVGVLAKKSLDAYADFEQLTGGVETLFKTSADTIKNYAANAYKTAGMSANQYMETVTGFSASLIKSLSGDTSKAVAQSTEEISQAYDNQYDAAKDSYDDMYDSAKDALDKEIDDYQKATDKKVELINEEYKEKLKIVDKEEYDRLQAIDAEIEALNKQEEEQKKAEKRKQQEEKKSQLQEKILQAKTYAEQIAAQKNYNDYLAEIDADQKSEERKSKIEQLKDEKQSVKDQATAKRDALKEEQEKEVSQVRDAESKKVEEMKKAEEESLKALKRSNDKKLKELKRYYSEQKKLAEQGAEDVAANATPEQLKEAAELANVAIVDMSDNANKMGTAMESIQNAYQGFAKQNYTMLDNLKLGYGGTKEEMARLISDASKLTDVQKELGVTVDGTDMSFANIVKAIHVMQVEMGVSGLTAEQAAEAVASGAMTQEEAYEAMGTTAKEASTTIQGSVSSMKAAWQNLLVGMADDKQDFGKLIDNFVESVATVGKNIMPRLKKILKGVAKLIKEIVPEIAKELPGIVNDILPDLANAAVDIVKGLVDALMDNADTLLDTGIKILDTLITGIIECIPKIKDLIPTIINAILRIIDVLTEHLDEFIEGGIQITLALLDGIIKAVPKILEKLPEICQKIIDGVLQGLFGLDEGVSNTFGTAFGNAVGGAIEIIKGILSFLNGDFSTGLESAGKGLSDVVGGILGIIDGLLGTSLQEWYDSTRAFFEDFGKNLYNATHQAELAKLDEETRLSEQTKNVGATANEYIRQGLSAADAFAKALSDEGISEAIWQQAVGKGIVTYDVNEAYQTLKETGQIKTATAEGTSNQINVSMKLHNGVELARATAYDNSKANRVAGRQIPAY